MVRGSQWYLNRNRISYYQICTCTGTFPYVVYGEACVASFANIVKYVDGIIKPASSLAEDEEEIGSTTASHERQSSKEKSQQTAWIAFVFANLGDLVVSR